MRVVVAGFGAVGRRVASHLASVGEVESVVVLHRNPTRVAASAAQLAGATGGKARVVQGGIDDPPQASVIVLTVPHGNRRAARAALARGSHVVSCADDPSEVKALLALDRRAASAARSIVAGVAMAPGLTCLLAAYLKRRFDRVDEIHVASAGTGGPACARRHHAALASLSIDWEDGDWRRRPGGSGRELVWFPEPIGGADCYRAGLADAMLLMPAFPGCRRITSRLQATRRDRMTSWLPMLRPPHPEGRLGAARVEVRGRIAGRAETLVMGSSSAPAETAAAVLSRAAVWAGMGRLDRSGSGGLATMIDRPGLFLEEVVRLGVKLSIFEGQSPDHQPPHEHRSESSESSESGEG